MKTLLTLLAWSLLATATQAQSSPNAPASAASPAEKSIIGVWTFVGNVGQPASTDKKTKIILNNHWMFSQPDPTSNLTQFHHGGTYSLTGNTYAETIAYANESTVGYLGHTFTYTVKIDGDRLTLTGQGNPYNEIWQRVK